MCGVEPGSVHSFVAVAPNIDPIPGPVPFWKDTLWRLRLSLWAIAAITFAFENIASMRRLPPTAERELWLERVTDYRNSLELSNLVALMLAIALLGLATVSFRRKETGPAVLDLCTIPLMLAWAGATFMTSALSFT